MIFFRGEELPVNPSHWSCLAVPYNSGTKELLFTFGICFVGFPNSLDHQLIITWHVAHLFLNSCFGLVLLQRIVEAALHRHTPLVFWEFNQQGRRDDLISFVSSVSETESAHAAPNTVHRALPQILAYHNLWPSESCVFSWRWFTPRDTQGFQRWSTLPLVHILPHPFDIGLVRIIYPFERNPRSIWLAYSSNEVWLMAISQ